MLNEQINKLISTWRNSGKFGLTLPFIFGALQLKGLIGNPLEKSFNDFLKSLETAENLFRISYCDKVDDLILAPVSNRPVECNIVTNNGKPTSLYVQHNIIPGRSVESIQLSQELWKRYKAYIEAERYSRLNGQYQTFSIEDLAIIEKSFESS